LKFNEYKAVVLETKASHEVFEDYDPKLIMLKINIWRPDIEFLDEFHMKPT
jgi:ubiquitin carboxyl-terminal hydrolase 47